MNDRVIIFGAAGTGQKIYKQIKDQCEVLFFADNNSKLWGSNIDGITIIPPEDILKKDYDFIYIGSMCGLDAISDQLAELGIPRYKLKNDLALVQTRSRGLFLEDFAKLVYKRGMKGAVAEAGVYRGTIREKLIDVFQIENYFFLIHLKVLLSQIYLKKENILMLWQII